MHRKLLYKILSLLVISLTLLPAPGLCATPPRVNADRVLIEKKARRLTLYCRGQAIKTFQIALGQTPDGPKIKEGDGRTPEGVYLIDRRNPNSRFHRSLHISYPGPADLQRARELGVRPGGDIMIHGIADRVAWMGDAHRLWDWTKGCIAVTNEEIEEIWRLVPDGTEIEILP
jgi:murein L,D-transpeptidase YafK